MSAYSSCVAMGPSSWPVTSMLRSSGALVADVDDGAVRRAAEDDAFSADEQASDILDRLLRRAEPDALQAAARERVEPFERQRQMRAALVAGDGVDLVDDHRLRVLQHLPAALGGEQDVERLGRSDQDVRRPAHHRLPLVRRRIAGAHERANLRAASRRCSAASA